MTTPLHPHDHTFRRMFLLFNRPCRTITKQCVKVYNRCALGCCGIQVAQWQTTGIGLWATMTAPVMVAALAASTLLAVLLCSSSSSSSGRLGLLEVAVTIVNSMSLTCLLFVSPSLHRYATAIDKLPPGLFNVDSYAKTLAKCVTSGTAMWDINLLTMDTNSTKQQIRSLGEPWRGRGYHGR